MHVGDLYVTRHSNLADVQAVLHLVVDDAEVGARVAWDMGCGVVVCGHRVW